MSERTDFVSYKPELVAERHSVFIYITSFKASVDVFRTALSVEIFKQDSNVISDWSRNYSVLSFFSGAVKRAFLYHPSIDALVLEKIQDVDNHIMNADLLLRQTAVNPVQLINQVEQELNRAVTRLSENLPDSHIELQLLEDDQTFCCYYFRTELKRVEKKISKFLRGRQEAHQKGQFGLCMELRLFFLTLVLTAFFQRISKTSNVDLCEWFEKCRNLHENSLKLITFGLLKKSIEKRINCCSNYRGQSETDLVEFANQIVNTLNSESAITP